MAEIKEAMPAPQPEALDMPDDEVLYELADLFRVFGDSTRIKILYALHDDHVRSILSMGMDHIEE